MTTSRRLWLGFGTLIALLVLFGVALSVRVASIGQSVEGQADEALPRSTAARELEVNVVGYALAVRTLTQTDDPRFRQKAADDAADVERYLAEYERLAATDRQRQLAARFTILWREYEAVGRAVLESRVRPLPPADSARLAALRLRLEAFLDDEMQAEAIEAAEAGRAAARRDVRSAGVFALVLLAAAVVLAVVTSLVVGRAEARVAAERGRVQFVADAVPALISYVDADARYRLNNHAYETWFGHPRGELAGRHMRDVLGDAAWAAIRPHVEAALAGRVDTYEAEVPYRDGGTRWILATYTPDVGPDGRARGLVAHVTDVTPLKRAERQVATTLESITDGFMRYDRDWRIVYVNAEAERINQFSRSEMLGKTPWELFPAVVGTKLEAEFRRAMTDRVTVEFENHYAPWDRWYALKCYPAPDGGLTTFVRDITDRRRAEERLAASEASYRRIVEGNPALICRFRPDGTLTFVNDTYCRTFGRAREDLVGHAFTPLVPAADRPVVDRMLARLAPDMEPYTDEHRVVVADGAVRWLRWSNTPAADGGDRSAEYQAVGIDITDRKEAEEQVRRGADLLTVLIDRSPSGFYIVDADFRISHVNADSQARAFRNVNPAVGRRLDDAMRVLWPEPLATEIIAIFRRTLDTGEPYRSPGLVSPRADLEAVETYEWQLDRITMPDGRYAVVCYFYDTTKLREAEQALRTSEERFRTLFNTMDEGFCVVEMECDPAGRPTDYRILEMNPAFAKHTGMGGLAGRSVREAIPDLEEFWYETYGRVAATGEPTRIVNEARPMGRWFDVYAFRLGGAGSQKVAVLFNDITDRRRAEQAVRDSEAHFRTMADTAPSMLWVTDAAGACTYLSRRWYEYTGRTPEQDLGLGWLENVHPDDRPEAGRVFLAATERAAPFALDHRLRRHDGEYRWVVDAGVPRFDPDGRFLGFVGAVTDVHDRRQAEEALKAADKRKDEFLATLAHELRNPLAPLRNGLQIMQMVGANGPVEQARAMMDRQLGQLVRLVDDLLDVSRITRGKVDLRTERVELRAVIDAAVETVRPMMEAADHELAVAVPDGSLAVTADPTRLAQVVSNLLTNSAKYTPPGGHIRLTVERDGGTVVVSVADDGIGIPPGMLDRVFEMFTQVDRTLEKTTGGLGIGLSLVKGLVEMHGGTIAAHSAGEGKGSEFVVRLPLRDPV